MKTSKGQLGGEPWERKGKERDRDRIYTLASKKEIQTGCWGQSVGTVMSV